MTGCMPQKSKALPVNFARRNDSRRARKIGHKYAVLDDPDTVFKNMILLLKLYKFGLLVYPFCRRLAPGWSRESRRPLTASRPCTGTGRAAHYR